MYLIYWLCIHLQVKVVFAYNIYSYAIILNLYLKIALTFYSFIYQLFNSPNPRHLLMTKNHPF